ncbi:hypothetical protein SASPL_147077 [Salvia splendens]|uniref:Uncharacterized protein n=1 Tax=Salvia splendens TaxID=180675 RepID=A0A8X8Z6D9_SALSN|nr:hypothetical protein SASPL_147077 [Salvia splendens]
MQMVQPKPSSSRGVPAPATPDIVARHSKASATDANECSHSKKRTCCRSLNHDTSENEDEDKAIGRPRTLLAYRGRRAKNLVEGTQNNKLISSFTTLPNELNGKIKFSEWKGSVMDSIVGAYLAQNVNDAISSPTFMLLAAKFLRNAASVVHKGKCLKRLKEDKTLRMRTKTKHSPALLNDMKDYHSKYQNEKEMSKASDAVDWDSVKRAGVGEISKAIQIRGHNNNLAKRINVCWELKSKCLRNGIYPSGQEKEELFENRAYIYPRGQEKEKLFENRASSLSLISIPNFNTSIFFVSKSYSLQVL